MLKGMETGHQLRFPSTMKSSAIFRPSKRIANFGQDVWSIFSPMALACQSVNLGQGFPNFKTPDFIKNAACNAINNDINQYSPPKGLLSLRKALSSNFSPLFGRDLDPENEIIVTAGANEGMYAAFLAFLDEGSEVICFEPFFDQYAPNISMSGGKMICCPLRVRSGVDTSLKKISSADWKIDMDELESKVTSRTRMLVLNTPHNPIGKVFDKDELEQIADFAIRHDLIVLSDEVYERLVYDGMEHVRIATLDGMWDRTITVGSAGKSFCVTGWRVGWLMGNSRLIQKCLLAHSRIVFCTNSPLQDAIASGYSQVEDNKFFESQLKDYERKRDFMVETLTDLGLPVTVPEGSYFILADISKLDVPENEIKESEKEEAKLIAGGQVPQRSLDWKICRWMNTHIGVGTIPPSEFYGGENAHLAEKYARFCFCKTDETLQLAKERLQKLLRYVKQ